jgi:hypothetical protein
VENYFSILKRGIVGTFHHVSEVHLTRYLDEFDFRYSNRSGLGVSDDMRANLMLNATTGKRLTYRRSGEGVHRKQKARRLKTLHLRNFKTV